MSINGISAGYYPTAYANNKTTKAETGKSFAEIASQKSAEADKQYCMDRASAALDTIGAYAPDEVRRAWMEAAEETGSNGFSITSDGKHFHGSRLLVQHIIRSHNGEADPDNILGNTIESAISVAEKALYEIDHPLPGSPTKSIEVQQEIKKERAFYVAFLDKLRNLSESAGKDSQNVSNYAFRTYTNIIPQKSVETDKEAVQEKSSVGFDSIGSQAPDEVRQAWKEAEAETGGHFGVGGFWISNDGKECRITKMFVDFFVRWYNGDLNQNDMLGNSVESAKSAVEKWIYDLDHPLIGQPARSIEERRLIEMERKFYESFLDKLMQLTK